MYRDIVRWCPEREKWLIWDGRRWKLDETDHVRVLAQRVMAEFGIQAAKSSNELLMRFAAGCRRSARITNALREAQPHLSIHAIELDTDGWLLNFQNGTVDLRTGKVLDHDPGHYITRIVEYNYNPRAKCRTFFLFLERITGGGPDAAETAAERSYRLMLFLQRAFGYSLTGMTSEKVVFLLYGPHDNAKSTLLALFLTLLGPYAVLLQIESLMVRQQESNNVQADLSDLNGARFVMTSETEEGQRLAEGRLKRITQGTGRIKAARKFENPIEFNETHKLWLDCNFLPAIRGYDEAIWRRLRTIPFSVVIPPEEQDRNLSAKLLKEAEGILAWAVQGALDWQENGLPPTPEAFPDVDSWGVAAMADGFNIDALIRSLIKETVAETVAQLARDGAAMPVKRRLLSVEEAAVYMGRSEEAMQHLIASGRIRTVRIDRRVFVDLRDLDKLIEDYKT